MNGFSGVMLEEGTTRRKLHRMLLVASAVVFSLSVLGIAISSHLAVLVDNFPLPIVSAVFWRCVSVRTARRRTLNSRTLCCGLRYFWVCCYLQPCHSTDMRGHVRVVQAVIPAARLGALLPLLPIVARCR
jgi:hypothetical protein